MDLDVYQVNAHETAIYDKWYKKFFEKHEKILLENDELNTDIAKIFTMLHMAYTLFGLSNEVGELLGKVKKVIRDGGGNMTADNVKEMSKELGDTMWYQSEFATLLDLNMSDVAKENLDKLYDRKERGVLGGSGDCR